MVVESGTGSASFSHSIARAVGLTGRLHTFDFHEARAVQAEKEFADHGLADIVTVQYRDVCNTGFGLESVADAGILQCLVLVITRLIVFLDLPAPWLAIPWAKEALRKDRVTRIACFSPCMEQVQRTIPELEENGFYEIEMYEILLRPLEVDEISVKRPNATSEAGIGAKRLFERDMVVAKHKSDIKGHTSYLYFASYTPQ